MIGKGLEVKIKKSCRIGFQCVAKGSVRSFQTTSYKTYCHCKYRNKKKYVRTAEDEI